MEVILYVPSNRGGHLRYSVELAHALDRLDGIESTVVTTARCDPALNSGVVRVKEVFRPLPKAPPWRAVRVVQMALYLFGRDLVALRRAVRGRPAGTVVHIQELTPALHGAVARWLRRRRFISVATVHNVRPHGVPAERTLSIAERVRNRGLRRYDALIVHHERHAGELRTRVPGPLLAVAPHGVWTPAVAPPPSEAARSPRVDVDWGGTDILCFGSSEGAKDAALPVRLAQADASLRVRVAGGWTRRIGSDRPPNLAVGPQFVDEPDLYALFRSARLVVLPYSNFHAQSGVLYWAAAARRPVVTTAGHAAAWVVDAFRAGIVVSDVGRVVSAALALLGDASAWTAAAEGMEDLARHHTWDVAAMAHLHAYRSVGAPC